ncbi:MAG: isopenicillin N synthase family oxygenase [bacterium]|nr:isopenicillin N synthase family oxygenase [bacterium]MCY4272477.1 isopenicillin N synthase family oxygenase [bacterium]
MSIPVVDLSGPRNAVVRQIDDAATNVGFLTVVGHGVDSRTIDTAWNEVVAFFGQSHDVKMTAHHPTDANHPYGYHALRQETLAASLGQPTPPDLKESFNVAPPKHHADPTGAFGGQDRLWPSRPTTLRPALEAYYDAMENLAGRILQLMAEALRLPATHFEPFIDQHLSALRGLHYPPVTQPAHKGQLRAGVHTDYGTITILLPGAGSGGLEVEHVEGLWIPVQPIDGCFVLNIGDLLARWTNDRWRSTRHRVALPATERARREHRYSIAFFHQPNWHAEVAPIETCVSAANPARHRTVEAGPWLQAKFDSAYKTSSPSDPAPDGAGVAAAWSQPAMSSRRS